VIEEIREEQVPEEPTAQPDPAEPAGDQDPAAEKEYDEAREEATEEVASDPAADAARYLDLAQRTQAELENLRKRAARDVLQAGARAKANLVRELLPVVDNLERALATANPEEDHLADGVRLVHAELVGTLERNGIKAFDPAGEPFDPTVHEAISMREGEKGYRLGDNVIRPARVVVSS
jgi:molecular chaperone GrpE